MRKWSNKLPMGKRTILQGTSQDRKWAIYMHSWCAHSLFQLEVLAYHCTQHIRSLVHPSYSLPKGQAGKFIFFAPWKIQVDPGATTVVCQHSQVTVQLYVNVSTSLFLMGMHGKKNPFKCNCPITVCVKDWPMLSNYSDMMCRLSLWCSEWACQ